MEYIPVRHAQIHKNSSTCSVYEYPTSHTHCSVAFIEINGRYPEQGWALNEVCTEMAYILNGVGTLVTPQKTITLSPQDLVLVSPGEQYYWEGTITMTISSTPAFYAEQHKIII